MTLFMPGGMSMGSVMRYFAADIVCADETTMAVLLDRETIFVSDVHGTIELSDPGKSAVVPILRYEPAESAGKVVDAPVMDVVAVAVIVPARTATSWPEYLIGRGDRRYVKSRDVVADGYPRTRIAYPHGERVTSQGMMVQYAGGP